MTDIQVFDQILSKKLYYVRSIDKLLKTMKVTGYIMWIRYVSDLPHCTGANKIELTNKKQLLFDYNLNIFYNLHICDFGKKYLHSSINLFEFTAVVIDS